MPSVRSAFALTGAVAALGSVVAVAPSFGANAHLFDITTAHQNSTPNKTKGSAHAYGSVEFDRRESALVQGRVNDLCPKDGNGAYLEMYVTFGPKGSVSGRFQDAGVIRDIAKCGGPGQDFKLRTPTNNGKRINGVHLYLKECDMTARGRVCNGDGGVADWHVDINRG
jgi:hypothetical protein